MLKKPGQFVALSMSAVCLSMSIAQPLQAMPINSSNFSDYVKNISKTATKEELANFNFDQNIQTKGKWSLLAKAIRSIASKIASKLPAIVVGYFSVDYLADMIDAYTGYQDTIEGIISDCVLFVLPSWLEWAEPGITTTIMFLLPFTKDGQLITE